MEPISDAEYAAYIGKNANAYLDAFKAFDQNGGAFKISWRWSAFFLTFWWCLYRKLYPWALVLLVVTLIPYINFVFMLAAGAAANYLYYRQARTQIPAIKKARPDMHPLEAIAAIGGVNLWAAVIAWIVYGVCAAGIIAAMLLPSLVRQ